MFSTARLGLGFELFFFFFIWKLKLWNGILMFMGFLLFEGGRWEYRSLLLAAAGGYDYRPPCLPD